MFWLVRLRAFIFHMSIPCDKTFLVVASSRPSVDVKVKYQGFNYFKKKEMTVAGALVFHKHSLFNYYSTWIRKRALTI